MDFVILRVLTHSELGMFHEYRRQGKEGSKQRAINFDGDVVDRVFPTAHDHDRIEMSLRYDTDDGVRPLTHFLTRQAKNWRLENNCPKDRLYAFVGPGCLFASEISSGQVPATGAWAVFPADALVTERILADGATGGLARAGMIALHGREGATVRRLLHAARPDLFTTAKEAATPMSDSDNRVEGGKRLPPRPVRTAEILGNTGHTFVSAVADIVDNSINADATEIDITFAPPDGGHSRWLTITDNGHGMTEAELDEAMTLGSVAQYEDNSLGKYGFGLKGASWSQAEMFTVVTRRRGGETYHLSWDQKNLGDWVALTTALEPWEEAATALGEQGTAILWKGMKPPQQVATQRGVPPYFQETIDLQRHLGLVFHRFLEGAAKNRKKVTIRINGNAVEPNGPTAHPLTEPHDVKTVRVPLPDGTDSTVQIQPFLLPSEDEIKQYHRQEGQEAVTQALNRTGYWGKRTDTQGMFIYRNDRLIKYGGWDGIWTTRDEKTKHARVTIDFGKKLDGLFDINISKMSVNLSARVLEEVKKLATPLRNASRRKFSLKDRPPAPPVTPTPGRPVSPPTAGPGQPPVSPPGAPASPLPPTAAAPPPPPPVSVRSVETHKFLWKVSTGLTGGRVLQVSDRDADLAALVARLKDDPEATDHLVTFLMRLDAVEAQKLFDAPADA